MISLDLDLYSVNIWFNGGDNFNLTFPTWLILIFVVYKIYSKISKWFWSSKTGYKVYKKLTNKTMIKRML